MEGQVNGKGGWRLSPGPGRGVGKACLVLASGPESPLSAKTCSSMCSVN